MNQTTVDSFRMCAALVTIPMVMWATATRQAQGELLDFDSFTAESFAPAATFSTPNWVVADLNAGSGDGLVAGEVTNSNATVFYNDSGVLDTRIKYRYEPGADDDLTGFVLGYNPGDTMNPAAGYLLFDWKRVEQTFNFADPMAVTPFNDLTAGSAAPASLRASWVQGIPTSDELWGKLNDAVNTSGGVTLLGNAATLGETGYAAGESYVFEVEYAADSVKLFVNGTEEFSLAPGDIPSGPAAFPQGRFGLYEAFQSPGSIWSQVDLRPLSEPSAPDPLPPLAPQPVQLASGVKAAAIDVDDANVWTVVASTGGANTVHIITPPNGADVEVGFGSSFDPQAPRVVLGLENPQAVVPLPDDGVMIATVRQNGPRPPPNPEDPPIFGTVEAPADHAGWGNERYGLATSRSPQGGEANVNVAIAFFPYADRWTGGWVQPGGVLAATGNGRATVTQLSPPSPPAAQDGLFNVAVSGADSQSDGLLFVVGSSNENNLAAATPLGDGTWNVAVRDNGQNAGFAGPEEFENDDFNFLYMPINSSNLVGGHVTDFDDTTGDAILAQQAGDFTLVQEGVGRYRLSVDGQTPEDGVLMLTSAEPLFLSDETIAPSNLYMTYGADGSDFLIEVRQVTSGADPALVDGDFVFAYISYADPVVWVPEPGAMILALIGLAVAAALHRRKCLAGRRI